MGQTTRPTGEGDDRGGRAGELAPDPLGNRAGNRLLRSARPRDRLRAQPSQGPRLPGGHGRRARRGPAVGAERAGHRHGARPVWRLRLRPAARPDRVGSARRAADRLRLQRHHRPAPGARRPCRLGHLLRAELPSLHAPQEGAHRGDQGLVPPRLRARAAGEGVRGSRESVRADGRRGRRRSAAGGGLPDAAGREHGHALRGADRWLRRHGRGSRHRRLPGRHGAQPPGPRRQARQGRRLRLRNRRQLEGTDPGRGAGVDALDRGGTRRADRSAGDPRDRQRSRRPRQAHGHDARSAPRPGWTPAQRPSR